MLTEPAVALVASASGFEEIDPGVLWDITKRELAKERGRDDGYVAIPPELEEMAPGLVLAAVLSGIDPERVSPHDRVTVLRAEQRMVSHFEARRSRSMTSIADSAARDVPDDPELGWDAGAAEIAAGLRLTRRSAEYELTSAQALRDRPLVAQALAAGRIDRRRATVLVDGTAHLSDEAAASVIGHIIDRAPQLTTGQLRAQLRRLCIEDDPDDARERYDTAVADRRVTTEMTPEGTANLYGLDLPPDQVAEIMAKVNALARAARTPGDPRTMDQARADVLLDLLLGNAVDCHAKGRGTVELQVDLATLAELSETPGELAGMGPVIADVARQVADRHREAEWRFTVTDPDSDSDSDQVLDTGVTRRRPNRSLRRHVEARDRTCVFPGCRMPANRSDIDHTISYANGGLTTKRNTAPLCRYHHILKTRTGWTYHRLPNGDYRWTSPLGHTYTTSGRDP